MQLLECVPNFSEGRNLAIIKEITSDIESIDEVKLLDVDSGYDANRTVVTFVGPPEMVIKAAFKAIKKASELIDMNKHSGTHSRMGATDVCPLVPIKNITLKETIAWSEKLARKVSEDLEIPIFLYEASARSKSRENLANIRAGEFEGLDEKIRLPEWKPDYGNIRKHETAGATAIGARKFLIAYNVNLNTKDKKIATDIALDIRENGRFKRDKHGNVVRSDDGTIIRVPGKLKSCKAVGWYIDEYKQAQISMNLTDYTITSPHRAFEECRKQARKRGVRVTGSELVGLIPLDAILDIGKYYLKSQNRSEGVPDSEIINIAIKSLGLDEIEEFIPQKKIIEFQIDEKHNRLSSKSVSEFADELSSESPAPGGGSVAALLGAMGASLSSMVSNLTIGKKQFKHKYNQMNSIAVKCQALKKEFIHLIDKDTDAFNNVMNAFRLPKKTDIQNQLRESKIQEMTKIASLVPFEVLENCFKGLEISLLVSKKGNLNSITDAGVASESFMAGANSAYFNILINLKDIDDQNFTSKIKLKANKILKNCKKFHHDVKTLIDKKLLED